MNPSSNMDSQYDASFEMKRLSQLFSKYISEQKIVGKISFRSLNRDHCIDSIRFSIDDPSYVYLKESGFNNLLIELLDDMSTYRYRFNIEPYNGGIIDFFENKMTITWLTEENAELLFK